MVVKSSVIKALASFKATAANPSIPTWGGQKHRRCLQVPDQRSYPRDGYHKQWHFHGTTVHQERPSWDAHPLRRGSLEERVSRPGNPQTSRLFCFL